MSYQNIIEELTAERDELQRQLEVVQAAFEGMNQNCAAAWKERDAARAEVERLTAVMGDWENTDAALWVRRVEKRAEKAEAEVERQAGWRRAAETAREASENAVKGLAAALRKIQNYTDETITCGWAREALEKFGGGE